MKLESSSRRDAIGGVSPSVAATAGSRLPETDGDAIRRAAASDLFGANKTYELEPDRHKTTAGIPGGSAAAPTGGGGAKEGPSLGSIVKGAAPIVDCLAAFLTAGATELGNFDQASKNAGVQLDTLGQSGEMGMRSFRSQKRAEGLGTSQERAKASADFEAETARFNQQAAFSTMMAETMSLFGGVAGGLAGSARKSQEYGAGGQLGRAGDVAFAFANGAESVFMRGVGGGYGNLRAQFGSLQVNAQFHRWGVVEAAQESMRAGGGGLARLFNDFQGMDGDAAVAYGGSYGYDGAKQLKISRPFES